MLDWGLGKKLYPKKASRQENGQGPRGLPEENMVQEEIICLDDCKKNSVLQMKQISFLPSVCLLEQIPEKSVLQLCTAAVLLPWKKLEAERSWPTWVRPLVMGTGHERSCGSFSWKRNTESQLMMALPMQIPSHCSAQLKKHSAVLIFCFDTLQAADFLLFPTPKRSAFQQLPISTVERCYIDTLNVGTLIDWEEI